MKDNLTAVPMAAILLSSYFSLADAADDAFSDMPVVLTNYSLEQAPSKTPVTISSIDRDLIEASGARTIPDALRLIPGMVIGHSVNDFGDKPLLVVAYHGHSDQFSRQMNVLIDGRSIYDPLLGGVNWYNIPISIDDIERIEVTRGPNASTYGSNSFQAVINIITRHASEDQGHYARVDAGNHEIFDSTYRYGGHSDGLDYRVTLATVNDDGQDRTGDNNADDDVNAGMVDYRLDYQVDTKNLLTYQGGYGRTNQQAHASLRENFKPLRVVKDTNAHQFLRWDSTIDNDESFVVQYFYNYLDEEDDYLTQTIIIETDDDPPIVFDPFKLPIDASFTSQRHNLEITHYVTPSDTLDLVWGVSGQQDSIDSSYYLNNVYKITRNTLRLFGNVVWNISPKHTFDLGVLLEKSEGTPTDYSPRLAYLYHFNPNHTFRAGVSRAVRTPFIFEQHGSISHTAELALGGSPVATVTDRVYNPDNMLETEKITSYEFGYYGKFLGDDLMINARIFQDNLEDLIEGPKKPDSTGEDTRDKVAFVFDNLYATRVRGFEAEMDYRISKTFRLVASSALLDIEATSGPAAGKRREYEESAPDASLSLLAMKDFGPKYSASAAYYYVGDMAWLDANHNNTCAGGGTTATGCGFRNTRGYRKLDLRVARHFRSGNDRVTAAIVLQNLLDEYSDYDSAPSSTAPAVEQNLIAFFEVKVRIR